jgi:hypothetical protein
MKSGWWGGKTRVKQLLRYRGSVAMEPPSLKVTPDGLKQVSLSAVRCSLSGSIIMSDFFLECRSDPDLFKE